MLDVFPAASGGLRNGLIRLDSSFLRCLVFRVVALAYCQTTVNQDHQGRDSKSKRWPERNLDCLRTWPERSPSRMSGLAKSRGFLVMKQLSPTPLFARSIITEAYITKSWGLGIF